MSIHTSARVTEVAASGVTLASGTFIPAELVVWAAGIKAPDLPEGHRRPETNAVNQLVVRPTLQDHAR